MELKRIIAKDSRTANAKAIALYGRDALIVSSEKVRGQVEVIVAVDVGASVTPTLLDDDVQIKANASKSSAGAAFAPVLQERIGHAARSAASASGPVNHQPLMPPMLKANTVSEPAFTPDINVGDTSSTNSAASQEATQAALQAQEIAAGEAREAMRAREIVDLVREELAQMRAEIKMARQTVTWQAEHSMSATQKHLNAAMAAVNVPMGMREAIQARVAVEDDLQLALEKIHAWLKQATKRSIAATPLSGVQVIVGPSGAGKTMMVGRLASAHAQTYDSSEVAMVSYCDQRPGAWSQIQLLAAKAGVECYRATTDEGLREILSELAPRRLVIIDTPGVQIAEHVARIRAVSPEAACHVLLPVDASAVTIGRFLNEHTQGFSSIMLSKLDEMTQPWALVDALCRSTLPLSYASNTASSGGLNKMENTEQILEAALGSLSAEPLETAQISLPAIHPGMGADEQPRMALH